MIKSNPLPVLTSRSLVLRMLQRGYLLIAVLGMGIIPFQAASAETSQYPPEYSPVIFADPIHPGEGEIDRRNPDRENNFWRHPSILLPDLRTLPPHDLKIVQTSKDSRQLRLSNTIWNSGSGPLELMGELDQATRQTIVQQSIKTVSDQEYIHPVGQFVWHRTHDHWHFEDFTIYELWSLTLDGRLDAQVSSSDKLSYCVIDTDVIDQNHPAFVPRRHYGGCGQRLQGLSAGWGDTYKSHLDGQSIDIGQVADGIYALVSRTNPTGMVIEANPYNNSALVYIEIQGNAVRQIDANELSEEFCLVNRRC